MDKKILVIGGGTVDRYCPHGTRPCEYYEVGQHITAWFGSKPLTERQQARIDSGESYEFNGFRDRDTLGNSMWDWNFVEYWTNLEQKIQAEGLLFHCIIFDLGSEDFLPDNEVRAEMIRVLANSLTDDGIVITQHWFELGLPVTEPERWENMSTDFMQLGLNIVGFFHYGINRGLPIRGVYTEFVYAILSRSSNIEATILAEANLEGIYDPLLFIRDTRLNPYPSAFSPDQIDYDSQNEFKGRERKALKEKIKEHMPIIAHQTAMIDAGKGNPKLLQKRDERLEEVKQIQAQIESMDLETAENEFYNKYLYYSKSKRQYLPNINFLPVNEMDQISFCNKRVLLKQTAGKRKTRKHYRKKRGSKRKRATNKKRRHKRRP
jgi:hypothetical protein